MKINMAQMQALYDAEQNYHAKLKEKVAASWRERRVLSKQTRQAANLCWKISENMRLESLFHELVGLGCSFETVYQILEVMGYEIEDDIFEDVLATGRAVECKTLK